jgi:chromosome segregation ATPase
MLPEVKIMKQAHVGALIEDLRGQFKVFGEALQTTNEKLDRLDGRMTGLEGRMTGLEGRMTRLDGRMTTLEDKVDGIAIDMADVKKRLTHVEHALNGGSRRKPKK